MIIKQGRSQTFDRGGQYKICFKFKEQFEKILENFQ